MPAVINIIAIYIYSCATYLSLLSNLSGLKKSSIPFNSSGILVTLVKVLVEVLGEELIEVLGEELGSREASRATIT